MLDKHSAVGFCLQTFLSVLRQHTDLDLQISCLSFPWVCLPRFDFVCVESILFKEPGICLEEFNRNAYQS